MVCEWIVDAIGELESYCEARNLKMTKEVLSDAKIAVLLETERGSPIRPMKVYEGHIAYLRSPKFETPENVILLSDYQKKHL